MYTRALKKKLLKKTIFALEITPSVMVLNMTPYIAGYPFQGNQSFFLLILFLFVTVAVYRGDKEKPYPLWKYIKRDPPLFKAIERAPNRSRKFTKKNKEKPIQFSFGIALKCRNIHTSSSFNLNNMLYLGCVDFFFTHRNRG